jgi:hypothetical protein
LYIFLIEGALQNSFGFINSLFSLEYFYLVCPVIYINYSIKYGLHTLFCNVIDASGEQGLYLCSKE